MWFAVVGGRSRIEAYFSGLSMWRANRALNHVGNTLYPEMVEVAERYGVDVSFMKNPISTRRCNLYDSEIFKHRPGYYDVIVFGDSSLTWSFSPQVMEQVLGKRVGFFGIESAQPLASMVTLAEQITKTYLKRDGTVVFLFAAWTWWISSEHPQWVHEIDDMAKSAQSDSSRSRFERTVNAVLGLPKLQAYFEFLEPYVAPLRYRRAHAQMFGRGCTFFSWGLGSNAFLLVCPQTDRADVTAAIPTNCASYTTNPYIIENLDRLSKANFPNTVVALPFVDHVMAPEFYCETYKPRGKLRVIDLPKVAGRYGVTSLEFEQETHLANTSTIDASVVLARALFAGD
jgi:hypothetical protein